MQIDFKSWIASAAALLLVIGMCWVGWVTLSPLGAWKITHQP